MLFLSVLLCIPFLYAVYNRFFHPLAGVPGPFWASISPVWLVWNSWQRRRPRLDVELHKRYGSVVRIRPDEVIFSNPDYFKAVYGAGTKFRKARMYEAMADPSLLHGWDRLDMLTEEHMEKLRMQRRFAGRIYTIDNAKRHEELMDNNTERWFKHLRACAGKPLDFYHELERLHIDTMTEVTFDEPYGAVERGTDDGHMTSIAQMWRWWSWIGLLPWLNKLDKAWAPWAETFGATANADRFPVVSFVHRKIQAYQDAAPEAEKEVCILDDLMKLTKSKPDFLPSWAIGLAVVNEGAGIDTLSWTMSTVISAIAMNPEVYKRVQTELQDAVTSSEMVRGQPVSYDAGAKLEYLHACIHEAQRMWPNIAPSLPRVAPPEGIEIDGYHIKGGMTVGMNSTVLGRSEKIFGPETDKFKPERWLNLHKERRIEMETKNLAFGGPSRKCPGMHLAWVVMRKTLPWFLLEFDVKVLNSLDGPPGPGGRVWRQHGMFPTSWPGIEVEIQLRK